MSPSPLTRGERARHPTPAGSSSGERGVGRGHAAVPASERRGAPLSPKAASSSPSLLLRSRWLRLRMAETASFQRTCYAGLGPKEHLEVPSGPPPAPKVCKAQGLRPCRWLKPEPNPTGQHLSWFHVMGEFREMALARERGRPEALLPSSSLRSAPVEDSEQLVALVFGIHHSLSITSSFASALKACSPKASKLLRTSSRAKRPTGHPRLATTIGTGNLVVKQSSHGASKGETAD